LTNLKHFIHRAKGIQGKERCCTLLYKVDTIRNIWIYTCILIGWKILPEPMKCLCFCG